MLLKLLGRLTRTSEAFVAWSFIVFMGVRKVISDGKTFNIFSNEIGSRRSVFFVPNPCAQWRRSSEVHLIIQSPSIQGILFPRHFSQGDFKFICSYAIFPTIFRDFSQTGVHENLCNQFFYFISDVHGKFYSISCFDVDINFSP